MHRRARCLALPLLLAGPLSCEAQDIYKCVAADGQGRNVSYQHTPCTQGVGKVLPMPRPPGPVGEPPADARVPKPPDAVDRLIIEPPANYINSNRRELWVGMSDLQVLNNRQWGRPLAISRNRAPRAWHEFWRYEHPEAGAKQLHFVNGKLAAIEDAPSTVAIATYALP